MHWSNACLTNNNNTRQENTIDIKLTFECKLRTIYLKSNPCLSTNTPGNYVHMYIECIFNNRVEMNSNYPSNHKILYLTGLVGGYTLQTTNHMVTILFTSLSYLQSAHGKVIFSTGING